MTSFQLKRATQRLWIKHARADRHGYQDDMCFESFAAALQEFERVLREPQKPKAPKGGTWTP